MVMATDNEYASLFPDVVSHWNRAAASAAVAAGELLRFFREIEAPVLFTRNGYWTPSSAECAPRQRKSSGGIEAKHEGDGRWRGQPNYEILPELAPLEEEVVLDKLTSSAFINTQLELVLRNLGITTLVVVGLGACHCAVRLAPKPLRLRL